MGGGGAVKASRGTPANAPEPECLGQCAGARPAHFRRATAETALSTQKRGPPAVGSEISLAALLKMWAAFLVLPELSGRLKKMQFLNWRG